MATKTKPLRILGLKRSPTKKDQEVYSFGICCVGGLIYNGFLYMRAKGSIIPPTIVNKNGKRYPLVKGHGVHWKRLRQWLEEELESYSEPSEETTEQSGSGSEQGG